MERQKKTNDKKDKNIVLQAAPPNWILSFQDKMQEIQDSLDVLIYKVEKLEAKLENLSWGKTKTSQAKQEQQEVLGFRIVQKWVTSGGKRYAKWYGLKQSNGKQVWVYIGDNKEQAEEKIRAWVKRQKKK